MKSAWWYDEWRGSMDGKPTMWIKRLLRGFGCRVDLHKMVGADDVNCFHTHPAYAIRIILWGGYGEELLDGRVRTWIPGMVGLVRPTHCHRINDILDEQASYSLWIRFPVCAQVYLRGSGWPLDGAYRDPDVILQPGYEPQARPPSLWRRVYACLIAHGNAVMETFGATDMHDIIVVSHHGRSHSVLVEVSHDECCRNSIENFNWRLPLDQQKRCIDTLREAIPIHVLSKWKAQVHAGARIGCDDSYFHFGVGMAVRNALRGVVLDNSLPPVRQPSGEMGSNWDDYYYGALDALAREP